MVAPKKFSWSFVDVAAVRDNRAFMAASYDDAAKDNIPVSAVLSWDGNWSRRAFEMSAVSMCLLVQPQIALLMLGNNGKVVRWGSKDFSEEWIDNSSDGPGSRNGMREIRAIGQHAYAVGMGRMVYRCEAEDNWSRLDSGVRADLKLDSDSGFNSIDGFSEQDIYAAGWDGEIWHYFENRWTKLESPTNLALQRVVCAPDGYVYIVGQRGVIIKGRENGWEVVEQDLMKQDFWGACWFKGKLYASTANGIYVLDDDTLKSIDIGSIHKSRADCFYRLSSNEDCMWSIGEKMAVVTKDAQQWSEVTYT